MNSVTKSAYLELKAACWKHVSGGRFAAVRPLDPNIRRECLLDSLHAYLAGDVQELDPSVAETIRQYACEGCLADDGDDAVHHFYATMLFIHLLCFNGAGFGRGEAPLVMAICAYRMGRESRTKTINLLKSIDLNEKEDTDVASRAFLIIAYFICDENRQNEILREWDRNYHSWSISEVADYAKEEPYVIKLMASLVKPNRKIELPQAIESIAVQCLAMSH